MRYIQRKDNNQLETVDQFETHKEARAMLKEYQLGDPYGYYYTSQRACKGWTQTQVKNALAWFALEETARTLADT